MGAPLRYLVDRAIAARHDSVFPWGTLVVNVAGSFGLGLVLGLARHHGAGEELVYGVGVGFFGALTTFSTFGYESARLVEDGARGYAALNIVISVAAGLAAAWAGLMIGSG